MDVWAPMALVRADGASVCSAVVLLQGVASVMEQNRVLLGQRGEKLSRLQEQTGDLAESAANFADMAKKLAEQERNKARWFG